MALITLHVIFYRFGNISKIPGVHKYFVIKLMYLFFFNIHSKIALRLIY